MKLLNSCKYNKIIAFARIFVIILSRITLSKIVYIHMFAKI